MKLLHNITIVGFNKSRAYFHSYAAAMPFVGIMHDRYERKKVDYQCYNIPSGYVVTWRNL
jgi:hypothetical protein